MQRLPIRLLAYKVRAKDGDCSRLGALEVTIGIRVAVAGGGGGGGGGGGASSSSGIVGSDGGTGNVSGVGSGFTNGGNAVTSSTTGTTGAGVKELVWKSQLLHSKIKSGNWPSHLALKKVGDPPSD